jgi:hypothetical protein
MINRDKMLDKIDDKATDKHDLDNDKQLDKITDHKCGFLSCDKQAQTCATSEIKYKINNKLTTDKIVLSYYCLVHAHIVKWWLESNDEMERLVRRRSTKGHTAWLV